MSERRRREPKSETPGPKWPGSCVLAVAGRGGAASMRLGQALTCCALPGEPRATWIVVGTAEHLISIES